MKQSGRKNTFSFSHTFFLIVTVLAELQYVHSTNIQSKGIIKDHTVVLDRDTLSDQSSLNSLSTIQTNNIVNTNNSSGTPIRFVCKKQVPSYSLRKNQVILPQTSDSPFRITVQPQTVKPGDTVKGSYSL